MQGAKNVNMVFLTSKMYETDAAHDCAPTILWFEVICMIEHELCYLLCHRIRFMDSNFSPNGGCLARRMSLHCGSDSVFFFPPHSLSLSLISALLVQRTSIFYAPIPRPNPVKGMRAKLHCCWLVQFQCETNDLVSKSRFSRWPCALRKVVKRFAPKSRRHKWHSFTNRRIESISQLQQVSFVCLFGVRIPHSYGQTHELVFFFWFGRVEREMRHVEWQRFCSHKIFALDLDGRCCLGTAHRSKAGYPDKYDQNMQDFMWQEISHFTMKFWIIFLGVFWWIHISLYSCCIAFHFLFRPMQPGRAGVRHEVVEFLFKWR